ncbi:MAG: hypothetical protein KDA63_01695 [Planctomycetales bacterium]|nr:hypothetical protein [Planctomycetales bacterium]
MAPHLCHEHQIDVPTPGRPGWLTSFCSVCGRYAGQRPDDWLPLERQPHLLTRATELLDETSAPAEDLDTASA